MMKLGEGRQRSANKTTWYDERCEFVSLAKKPDLKHRPFSQQFHTTSVLIDTSSCDVNIITCTFLALLIGIRVKVVGGEHTVWIMPMTSGFLILQIAAVETMS